MKMRSREYEGHGGVLTLSLLKKILKFGPNSGNREIIAKAVRNRSSAESAARTATALIKTAIVSRPNISVSLLRFIYPSIYIHVYRAGLLELVSHRGAS